MECIDGEYDAFISYSYTADMDIAEALQIGLEQLAKPWHKRRALSIFRDTNALGLTPELWPALERRLNESKWLIVLASPLAADSDAVEEEIRCWLESPSGDPSRVLLALTDGELSWNRAANDYDPEGSNALPPALAGVFDNEPRHLDLRWVREPEGRSDRRLDLANLRFRAAVADIAAPIHGISRADIEGEIVVQDRRTRRYRNGAIASLSVVTIAALFASILAFVFLARANDQTAIAEARALESLASSLAAESRVESDLRPALALALAAESLALVEEPTLSQWRSFFDAAAQLRASDWKAHGPAMRGHADAVDYVLFSPSGSSLLSGSYDGTVRVWDPVTSTADGEPLPAPDGVQALAVTPDGRFAAVQGEGGAIDLWDLDERALTSTRFLGHEVVDNGGSLALAFDGDGSRLVSASNDGRVILWTVGPGERQGEVLISADEAQTAAVFSPEGTAVATAGSDNQIRIHAIGSGETGPLTVDNEALVTFLEYRADGSRLYSADALGRVRSWNPETGEMVDEGTTHGGLVGGLALNRDGSLLASASIDGSMMLWDPEDLSAPLGIYEGHAGPLVAVDFSPDGTLLATASHDDTVQLWANVTADLALPIYDDAPVLWAVAFTDDGERLVIGTDDGRLVLWDTETRREAAAVQAHEGTTAALAVDRTGRLLASGGDSGQIRLWAAESLSADPVEIDGHGSSIHSLAFSPMQEYLASGDRQGTLSVWKVDTGELLSQVERAHDGIVLGLAFHPSSGLVASAGDDGLVKAWDPLTGALVGDPYRSEEFAYTDLGHSADGERLLAVGASRTLNVWDTQSGELLHERSVLTNDTVFAMDVTAQGFVATGSIDGAISILDPDTAEPLTAFFGHQGPALDVAARSDGKVVATVGADGAVQFWPLGPSPWLCRSLEDDVSHEQISVYLQGREPSACNYRREADEIPLGPDESVGD